MHVSGSTEQAGGFTWGVGQWAGTRFMTVGWASGSHPMASFPNDGGYLTMLTEVQYDARLPGLVSNPLRELASLRNGTLGTASNLRLAPGTPHVIGGSDDITAASADVVVSFELPGVSATPGNISLSVCVLSDPSANCGVAVTVEFNGALNNRSAVASIGPCGGNESVRLKRTRRTTFPLLPGETTVDIRVVVDRSIVPPAKHNIYIMYGDRILT
jgi:hypothetical protein